MSLSIQGKCFNKRGKSCQQVSPAYPTFCQLCSPQLLQFLVSLSCYSLGSYPQHHKHRSSHRSPSKYKYIIHSLFQKQSRSAASQQIYQSLKRQEACAICKWTFHPPSRKSWIQKSTELNSMLSVVVEHYIYVIHHTVKHLNENLQIKNAAYFSSLFLQFSSFIPQR